MSWADVLFAYSCTATLVFNGWLFHYNNDKNKTFRIIAVWWKKCNRFISLETNCVSCAIMVDFEVPDFQDIECK